MKLGSQKYWYNEFCLFNHFYRGRSKAILYTFCGLMLFYYKIIQVNDLINCSNNDILKYISNVNLRPWVEVNFIYRRTSVLKSLPTTTSDVPLWLLFTSTVNLLSASSIRLVLTALVPHISFSFRYLSNGGLVKKWSVTAW